MATLVLTNAFISLDGNDISDHTTSVTVNYEAEAVDETAFGDTTRINKGGLKNWSVDLELHDDFAASQVDSILFPLVGTVVVIIVRPDAGVVSATNPNYTGSVLVQSIAGITGTVGDLATVPVSLVSAGDLSRAVA